MAGRRAEGVPGRRRPGPKRHAGPGTSASRLPVVHEVSAGGLVVSGQGDQARAALIGRLDRRGRMLWSLPKGHVEAGETAEATAVREVAEETGIRGSVREALGTITFWFVADGSRIHKTVHHFLLIAESGELSDDDVEVSAVEWVPLTSLGERLAHADERGLVADLPHLLKAIA